MNILGIIASQGGTAAAVGDFESIATASSSGSVKEVNFTNIPQTYQHLQIRGIYQNGGTARNLRMTLNTSITSSRWHYLFGLGSGTPTSGASTDNMLSVQDGLGTVNMYAIIIDILDYRNTNKNKTIRNLHGFDNNGNGVIGLASNLYSTTNAITDIKLFIDVDNWVNGTQFALYGIKG